MISIKDVYVITTGTIYVYNDMIYSKTEAEKVLPEAREVFNNYEIMSLEDYFQELEFTYY